MKTLHLYLTRQVIATLLMTVAVFTFVLLLGNVLREIMALLVNQQANLWTVLVAIGLLIPFVLVFALPMGMLTATLLTFGRFSADQELTAARAGGVSLLALVTPILLLSVALSGVCAFVNMQIAPASRVLYKRLLYEMGIRRAGALLPAKTYISDFPGRIVYLGKVEGSQIEDLMILNLEGQQVDSYIRASHGELEVNSENDTLRVKLRDAWLVELVQGKRMPIFMGEWELPEIPLSKPSEEPTQLSDMTFLELQKELEAVAQRIGQAIPYQKGVPVDPEVQRKWIQVNSRDLSMPIRLHMHRQISFSFACIGFTLVGIPLGIGAHRRETTFGIALALLLVAVYYSGFIIAQGLETRPEWSPHLILWLPNFFFQIVGMSLLWRANRGN